VLLLVGAPVLAQVQAMGQADHIKTMLLEPSIW